MPLFIYFFFFCREDDGDKCDVYSLAFTKPLAKNASMIALQVVRTSFGFHLRECMGSCFPAPLPGIGHSNKSY